MDMSAVSQTAPIAVIAGFGPGLGVSLAGAFASAGHDILALSRSDLAAMDAATAVARAGRTFTHAACDLADALRVEAVLAPLAHRVDVLVFAAHRLFVGALDATDTDTFEAVWRTGCLGAFNAARAVGPQMAARGCGAMIFVGATASVRGGARFAAFASAKFALRGLSQSLAREFGPKGVHVSHVILDGLIDEPQTIQRFGSSRALRMDPSAIATCLINLTRQPRSAWTHELDLRPHSEAF